MSVLNEALKATGLKLEADALPKQDRKVKVFQRLIAAVRAAEAELQDQLSNSERELNDALKINLELQERCNRLEAELRRYRVTERLAEIESLTSADRTKLLEVA